ncbi:MAG: thioredoxin domain-containing protein [Candidatus Saccharibacteria bacterium]|nr:thioredoxin domain-containing protein [Candidatus Saccharibacteria bacterium]
MDRTRWIIFAVICVVLLGGLVLNKKSSDVRVDNLDPAKIITSDNKGAQIPDHVFGTTSQKVVLIEYGDFQCPACGNLYPALHPLKDRYKDQLTFVFRNFPLTSIHPNALAGATAAEAAGLQDKFWEYHDKLYESQDAWSTADTDKRTGIFVAYAKELGLDTTKFKKDLENEKVSNKIDRDQALGKKIGASSTPTLVLNGKIIDQSKWETSQKLEATIVKAIKDSGQTVPQ